MQACANPVQLEQFCKINIYSASVQPRTNPSKFGKFWQHRFTKGTSVNISTKNTFSKQKMHFQSQLATAARRTLGVPSSSSRRPGAARRVHPPAPACLASPAPGPPASRPVCASHDHLFTFSSPEHSDFPNILQKNIFVELQTIFESTKQYFYPLLHILPTSSQAEQGLANARAARAGTASARHRSSQRD